MKHNPLLENGMVVWKGKDPRRNYCYYTFEIERYRLNKRSICFEELVPVAEKLGFSITPHWTQHGQLQGWYAVAGLQHHGLLHESDYDKIEVNPVVHKILNNEISNKSFKNLLSMENE
jgi:hypothetical protein